MAIARSHVATERPQSWALPEGAPEKANVINVGMVLRYGVNLCQDAFAVGSTNDRSARISAAVAIFSHIVTDGSILPARMSEIVAILTPLRRASSDCVSPSRDIAARRFVLKLSTRDTVSMLHFYAIA